VSRTAHAAAEPCSAAHGACQTCRLAHNVLHCTAPLLLIMMVMLSPIVMTLLALI
jgi:hypothetical protein